ncbi:MAG: hypothetical protein ABJN26_25755 [Stappiaceae bacterium]
MVWMPFDTGASIGNKGSEGGVIVADYEHEMGARITIERDGDIAPFAITCGIYGWFVHTRFFSTHEEADGACAEMQTAMNAIIQIIPLASDPDCEFKSSGVSDAIERFLDAFP